MKSVLISIQPKWCEKIARGEKTIEVRKTKPKLRPPFKCYIYRTKGAVKHLLNDEWFSMNVGGNVIGEFVCDKILGISISCSNPDMLGYPFPCTGLTDREIMDYLGNGKTGYGWHISDLVIYDTPKELSEFYKVCPSYGADFGVCWECENAVGEEFDCSVNGRIYLSRPPQSWCYVEGGADE